MGNVAEQSDSEPGLRELGYPQVCCMSAGSHYFEAIVSNEAERAAFYARSGEALLVFYEAMWCPPVRGTKPYQIYPRNHS